MGQGAGSPALAKGRKTAMSQQMAAAFFDLDGTLVSGDLMSQLFAHVGANLAPIGPGRTRGNQTGRERALDHGRVAAPGRASTTRCGLFRRKKRKKPGPTCSTIPSRLLETCVYPGALHLLGRHRGARHPWVLVTANAYVIARVAADWLGMDHVIATQLEVKAAAYTGEIAFGAWGQGKAEAMQRLAGPTATIYPARTRTGTRAATPTCYEPWGTRPLSIPTTSCGPWLRCTAGPNWTSAAETGQVWPR